ncbi:hypothetical protein DOY81_002765 [Sarcophaga bullata]|nr:hypothetical protein DOY81_002765 [Sarcophaga bullata]
MESEVFITITHFINPHLFWYKTIESDNVDHVRVLKNLEQSLDQLYKNKPHCDNQLHPQIGDKVAVNFIAWNKFIRAEILQKAEFQQEEYIVWLIDYGFPLLTKKEYIRDLPMNVRNVDSNIQMGGISRVYPAEQEFDDEEGNLVLVKKDKWLQKTCNMLEKLLTDASSISFVIHYENLANQQNWGDLIVINHRGTEINTLDYLLKTTNAIEEKNLSVFQKNCSKLTTTKVAPWLSNDRNTKMKLNTIKHNYVEHSKQMAAALIDEQAKRKVEDWQKRNEKKEIDEFSEIPEIVCAVENNRYVDEITFDDSVSVVQEKNYIGKAGTITKNKRHTNTEISEAVLANAFQMDDMLIKTDVNAIPQPSGSLLSSSTNTSVRLQKLAELRRTTARNKYKDKLVMTSENVETQKKDVLPLSQESTSSSIVSSTTTRRQKLLEIRKKTARAQKQYKTTETNNSEQNVTIPSSDLDFQILKHKQQFSTTISSTNTLDKFLYDVLDQSTTLSELDATTKTQGNKSGKFVDNARTKRLIALRTKLDSSSVISNNSETKSSTEKVGFILHRVE